MISYSRHRGTVLVHAVSQLVTYPVKSFLQYSVLWLCAMHTVWFQQVGVCIKKTAQVNLLRACLSVCTYVTSMTYLCRLWQTKVAQLHLEGFYMFVKALERSRQTANMKYCQPDRYRSTTFSHIAKVRKTWNEADYIYLQALCNCPFGIFFLFGDLGDLDHPAVWLLHMPIFARLWSGVLVQD